MTESWSLHELHLHSKIIYLFLKNVTSFKTFYELNSVLDSFFTLCLLSVRILNL
jgi:hypothetical protein